MHLFTRNSPCYHLLKYLLFLLNTQYIYIYIYIYINLCVCKYININFVVYLKKFSHIIILEKNGRKISMNSVVLVSVMLKYVLRKALSDTEN